MAEIRLLHTRLDPAGHFVRLGQTGVRKLETLHASGRLSLDRVVADAAHFGAQVELIRLLQAAGLELVASTRR